MTTPICYFSIIEPDDVSAFREACITDEQVSCSWSVLESWLNSLIVSDIWWGLTRDERYSIANMAITNTMFFCICRMRKGKPNCEGGEGDWNIYTTCGRNTYIRILKFATSDYAGCVDECYWKESFDVDENEHCWKPDHSYGLPCYTATVIVGERYNGGPQFAHGICALLIDEDVSIIDNWIFFQYDSFDIKPGDLQMPIIEGYTTYIKVWKVTEFSTTKCNFVGGDLDYIIHDWEFVA